MQGDVKSVNAERKLLSRLRLDLDASRNRARKATGDRLTQAQADLDKTQRAFEQQYEVTKLLLENIQKANVCWGLGIPGPSSMHHVNFNLPPPNTHTRSLSFRTT